MSDLAALLDRLYTAVCDLPETAGRLDKRDVLDLIRAERAALLVPVPRQSREETSNV